MREKIKKLLTRWINGPEYVYLFIALIGVIGFVFLTPPFQGPDEEAHYVRAQYIAHGYLIPVNVKDSSAALPKSIANVAWTTFYTDDLRGRTTDKYELSRTKQALGERLNSQTTYKPPMVTYSPLPYLPAVPGVFISNVLNLSPLVSLYAARLSLGLASVALVFFAIKFIPQKKYLLVAVGLVPMMIFQQSVVSADGVSYALLILFTAYLLRLYNLKEIKRGQWIIFGLLCMSLVLAKPLLYLFLPLALMLVKRKYSLRWLAGIGVACALLLWGWSVASAVKTEGVVISGTPTTVDSKKQLDLLVAHPKHALRVGWSTYMTTYGDGQVRGVIGIFGAADTVYPEWMFGAYAIVLGVAACVSVDKKRTEPIKRKWKIVAALLCLLYFVLVNAVLYLTFTPVNFAIVYGVQGRYFLPILVIVAAVILTGGLRIADADKMKFKAWLTFSILILMLLALFITIQRYYLYTP